MSEMSRSLLFIIFFVAMSMIILGGLLVLRLIAERRSTHPRPVGHGH